MNTESLEQLLSEEQITAHEARARRDRRDSRIMFAASAAGIVIGAGWLLSHNGDGKLNANNILPVGLTSAAMIAGAGGLLYGMRIRNQANAHEQAAAVLGQELRVEQGLQSPTEPPTLPPTPKAEGL